MRVCFHNGCQLPKVSHAQPKDVFREEGVSEGTCVGNPETDHHRDVRNVLSFRMMVASATRQLEDGVVT